MKKVLFITLVLTVSIFAKVSDDIVKKYMEISGTNQTIEELNNNIAYSINQKNRILGLKSDKKLLNLFGKAFNPDDSKELVLNYLKEQLKREKLQKIIRFYKSDIGKKIVASNLEATNSGAKAESLRFFASLETTPPSKKRIELIKEFVAVTKLEASVKDIFAETIYFLNYQAPQEKRIDENKLEQYISIIGDKLDQQIYLSALFTYRELSDQELKKVISFYKSGAGKRERDVMIDATKRMVRSGFAKALKSAHLIK